MVLARELIQAAKIEPAREAAKVFSPLGGYD